MQGPTIANVYNKNESGEAVHHVFAATICVTKKRIYSAVKALQKAVMTAAAAAAGSLCAEHGAALGYSRVSQGHNSVSKLISAALFIANSCLSYSCHQRLVLLYQLYMQAPFLHPEVLRLKLKILILILSLFIALTDRRQRRACALEEPAECARLGSQRCLLSSAPAEQLAGPVEPHARVAGTSSVGARALQNLHRSRETAMHAIVHMVQRPGCSGGSAA
eukprot:1156521-Pelagomonas_calceolata.AAC.18